MYQPLPIVFLTVSLWTSVPYQRMVFSMGHIGGIVRGTVSVLPTGSKYVPHGLVNVLRNFVGLGVSLGVSYDDRDKQNPKVSVEL